MTRKKGDCGGTPRIGKKGDPKPTKRTRPGRGKGKQRLNNK